MLVALFPAAAAVTEAWVQHFTTMANSSNDKAVKVVRDAAGDIIVAGASDDGVNGFDMLTIKYSATDGAILWQRRYNNPAGGAFNADEVRALAVDGEGNVVVTGRTRHDGQGDNWYTAKYAAEDGALIWERETHMAGLEESEAAAVDGSGNVIFLGSSSDGTTLERHVIKYDAASGAPLWSKVIRSTPSTGNSAIAVDGGGNVVVDVIAFLGNDQAGSPYYGRRTVRLAAVDGAVLWGKNRSELGGIALAVDGVGHVFTASARAFDEEGNYVDCHLVKHAAVDGSVLWSKGILNDEVGGGDFLAMALDSGGNVVLARPVIIPVPDHPSLAEYVTAKYAAADGALLWENHFNGSENSGVLRAVAVDSGGHVVVTGELTLPRPGGGLQTDLWTVRYAAVGGALLWEQRTTTPVDSSILAHAITVDAGGNVAVVGTYNTDRSESGNDYYTARYAAANGAKLWEKTYDGPANSADKAQAVAMDSGGNVIVTGISYSGIYPYNGVTGYTAKYAAASGALMWESRSAGWGTVVVDGADNVIVPGTKFRPDGTTVWSRPFGGRAFAVDASGNAICGTSDGHFYTAKYAAADGAMIWEKARASAYGYLSAVAVDAHGNVIVTGASGGDGSLDYYTAKYEAASGALMWEKQFDGPLRGQDVATAVSVDAEGNIVVTGRSQKGVNDQFFYYDSDYLTIKYAAADGAVLWETRYDSWDDGDDFANAVAVDAAGNVVVTGSSAMGAGEWFGPANTYTAKYGAADGALLWERREGSGATALALDASGNAVVTGVVGAGFYTAKYAAADGATLWGRGYSRTNAHAASEMGNWDVSSPNPRGMIDSHSLALGPNGTIAIAGTVDGGRFSAFDNDDFATILYRELPGPVSFAAWAAGFGLTGAEASPEADPDHDGIPNGVEFVLGGNPQSSITPHPAKATFRDGNMVLTLAREDRSETPDVTLKVETSTDLVNWTTNFFFIGSSTAHGSSRGVTIAENGDAPDSITVEIPHAGNDRVFARLKVTISIDAD